MRGRHNRPERLRGQGFEYVHSAVDDHSRLAYSEIPSDERTPTCAAFLGRAARFFFEHGITHIERVMTDNALSYRLSAAFADDLAELGARQVLIRPHCPWTNGKVERFRTSGLRTCLSQQPGARLRSARLAQLLQHRAPPHRPRRPPADQPAVNDLVTDYT